MAYEGGLKREELTHDVGVVVADAQGILGDFDTLYYHEWRARLVAIAPLTSPELRLHAARDGIYAIVMSTLPWLAWQGGWALVLAALLAAEIGFLHSPTSWWKTQCAAAWVVSTRGSALCTR